MVVQKGVYRSVEQIEMQECEECKELKLTTFTHFGNVCFTCEVELEATVE